MGKKNKPGYGQNQTVADQVAAKRNKLFPPNENWATNQQRVLMKD
jgi:hypothetical protein